MKYNACAVHQHIVSNSSLLFPVISLVASSLLHIFTPILSTSLLASHITVNGISWDNRPFGEGKATCRGFEEALKIKTN